MLQFSYCHLHIGSPGGPAPPLTETTQGGLSVKKVILLILTLLLAFLIAVAAQWEPVMDLLPFDRSGWVIRDGATYYLDEKGDPLKGWQDIEGNRYYFDEDDGMMFTGLCPIDLVFYSFDQQGAMQTGWVDGRFFTTDGSMAIGLWEIDGQTYCFLPDGALASGWTEVEGIPCFFSENGTPQSGWLDWEGRRYYLNEDGSVYTGWLELDGQRYYLNTDGSAASGWTEVEGIRYYIGENGVCGEGWNEIDGKRFYMNSDGSIRTGWLELDGKTYYLKEDGSAATGKLDIDGTAYCFTATGASIILVNPWNYIPDDYEVELVTLDNGKQVAREMYDDLMQMLSDCEAAGHRYDLRSAYRTHADQQANYKRILEKYDYNPTKAAQVVALPGTSEHQLGLAVDITDYTYRDLNSGQEDTATQQWLMEHCWDYGFILRYPNEKSEITGIIYEPWHYRYVGRELALELKDSGLCLEEYLENLTVQ